MTYRGTVRGGVVVLDEKCIPPEGTRVEVAVKMMEEKKPTLSDRLLKHAGAVSDLPSDMAGQHDHYLYGTPKR